MTATSREWKPGEVALIEAGCWANRKTGLRLAEGWAHTNGVNVDGDGVVAVVRPIVVIDPEDEEAVERLSKAIHESDHIAPWHDLHNETRRQIEDAVRAALREFANPTPLKPDEPTELGARVTDRGGCEWAARTGLHPAPDGMGLTERRWGCLNGAATDRTWEELCDERGPLIIEVRGQ